MSAHASHGGEVSVIAFRESGGGVTFSGGEPLMQYGALLELLKDTGGTTAVSAQMAMLAGGFGIPATGRTDRHGL